MADNVPITAGTGTNISTDDVTTLNGATVAAGTGTGTVTEATLTNGAIGTASTAANTIARVVFTAVTKAAADSLAVSWQNKFLGA